jgi:hypothetical protein
MTAILQYAISDHPAIREVLDAAADNDLYRINEPPPDEPCNWRRKDGRPVDKTTVYYAITLGLLGDLAHPERLPDGTWVSRMDLSPAVLDEYVALYAGSDR